MGPRALIAIVIAVLAIAGAYIAFEQYGGTQVSPSMSLASNSTTGISQNGTPTAEPATGTSEPTAPTTAPESTGGSDLAVRGAVFEDDYILGNPLAPVTIIEYASLTCPHCRTFHQTVLPRLKEEFITPGLARLVYRDFPLDQAAYAGAVIARCAPKERYFDMIGLMFETQPQWTAVNDASQAVEELKTLAANAGLSPDAIAACLQDKDLGTKVVQRFQQGQQVYEISGTPSLIVNGKKVDGAGYEAMAEAIHNALGR